MSALPPVIVTDTELTPGPDWSNHPHLIDAAVAWCKEHGIDAREIPQESTLVRDVEAMTVTYHRVLTNGTGGARHVFDGHLMTVVVVHQLEHPPAPWPQILVDAGKGGWRP